MPNAAPPTALTRCLPQSLAAMSLINNLFAATKAVLADKDLAQQKEDEAKLRQLNSQLQTAPAPLAVEQQGPGLGQIIHSTTAAQPGRAAAAITALLYHNGYVIVCTSAGAVILINAATLTVEATIDIVESLPITAAATASDCVVTGHSNGAVYSTSLDSLTSTLLTTLPSATAPIVAITLINQSLYIATSSTFYLSLSSSTITAAVSPSSATLTAMAVEAKGDVVWLGDADGAVWRLAVAEREISRLDKEGERRPGTVRSLLLTSSPLMKKVKRAPAKKKGAKAAEEEQPAEDDEKEEGGPSLVWCSRGGGRVTVWDTRDGKNSIVLDTTHVSPAALSTLTASLSQPSGNSSLSLPLSPVAQHTASLSTRSAALLSAPSSTSSSASSLIHQLLYLPGQSLLLTAHEERCLAAMSVQIEATKDGAVRVLPDGDNGSHTYRVSDGMREAATLLLLVPAEPVRQVAPLAQQSASADEGSENASAAAAPVAEEQQMDEDAADKSRPVSATPPVAAPAAAAATEVTQEAASSPSNALSTAPYILAATVAGDVHLYPLPALLAELSDRKEREAKRLDETIDGWLDSKNKASKSKAGAAGKAEKGKKKGADLLSVRDERKDNESALTTARD